MESKNEKLTSEQLQKQATAAYLRNEGKKMIISPDSLSEGQNAAEEEREKATETTTEK